MMTAPIKSIILAAGKGTRMKSDMLKVAHQVAGKPIVQYVLDAVTTLGVDKTFMVVGHQSDLVKNMISSTSVEFVEQHDQLGTGHAVMQVKDHFDPNSPDHVIVLAGDCPLIDPKTLKQLFITHQESNASATILSTILESPGNYGRILKGETGVVNGICEAKDCTPEQLLIQEINTGIYFFKSHYLFEALEKITTNNQQGEYYLTDVIHILKESGHGVRSFCTPNHHEALGVNTRHDLSLINKILYTKNNTDFMTNGVTIIDPSTTYIDSTVTIGQDTIIHPFSMILGNTTIGERATIGPHAYINNASISAEETIAPFSSLQS